MKKSFLFPLVRALVAGAVSLCLVAGAHAREAITGTHVVSYSLPAESAVLYPDKGWLPGAYRGYYPSLAETIRHFTQQSVDRSGLVNTRVSVAIGKSNSPQVTLAGPDEPAMRAFAAAHQAFLDKNHAVQGLNGVRKCKRNKRCWDPHPDRAYPWVFFPPFGAALIDQPLVNFMEHPSATALEQKDYLDDASMRRWADVLETVGIDRAERYEVVVDGRPIAVAGSAQAEFLPDMDRYFNSTGNAYAMPMLSLFAASTSPQYTKAVAVLGAQVRADWAKIVGVPRVQPGDVGTTRAVTAGRKTNWVAGNHPDVTPGQCCPGDPSPACRARDGHGANDGLLRNEQLDLTVACIEKGLGESPAADVRRLKAECETRWNPPMLRENQAALCMRARLDYNWEGRGSCKTMAEAIAFCAAHANHACASNPQGVPLRCDE